MAGEGSDRSGGPVPTTAHRTGRTPGRGVGARWGTAAWGVIDQALSSSTNFGVGLAAARATGPASFGAFSVAFATYLLGVGATRAVVSEVYAVRHATAVLPSDDAASRYPEAGEAWGATALLGLLAAVACLAAAAGAAGDLRIALGLVAVAFPVLVLHDVARYILITRRDAFGAMLLDLAWVVGFGGGLGVTAGLGRFPGAMATLALWIGGAACGVLVAAWRLRTLPDVRRGPAFWTLSLALAARQLRAAIAAGP